VVVREFQISLVLVQPTPFCNLDCSYCYLPDRNNRARMSLQTLETIFRDVFQFPITQNQLYVQWHAGEPMVVPPDWYREAFACIQRLAPDGVQVRHRFQTNATLINETWCSFLTSHANDIEIRVSVDGPQDLHDRSRRTRRGAGSFNAVMNGLTRLRQHHIPFGVLSVLTRQSLLEPDALFWFYDSIGVTDIAFNFEEVEGVHQTTSLVSEDAPSLYRNFLRHFCNLMRTHGRIWHIRQIDEVFGYLRQECAGQSEEAIPGRYICVDHRGGVSTFSPELLGLRHPYYGDFVLGNLNKASLLQLIQGSKSQLLARDIADGVELCRRTCGYFDFCGARFLSNKLLENGTFASTETVNCHFRIKITVDTILEELAQGLHENRSIASRLPVEADYG
jgi:uncharacterized protein